MKTLNVLILPFALLTLSGCYNPAYFQEEEIYPVYVPLPPPPRPPHHPRPPAPIDPPPTTPITLPQPGPEDPPLRESGNLRKGANDNEQESRKSGAERTGSRTNPPQPTQDSSRPTVPVRGNNATQENPVRGQRGGR